jgi:hypothetical protein
MDLNLVHCIPFLVLVVTSIKWSRVGLLGVNIREAQEI